jgi:protein involved in polysaccharide export with SLBB domain
LSLAGNRFATSALHIADAMIRESFFLWVWVGLTVSAVTAANQALAADSSSAAQELSPEARAYLQRLNGRLVTNDIAPAPATSVASAPTNASLIPLDTLDNEHKLGIGDRLSFRIVQDKDEPKSLFVTDSGELEVPYLGRVAAAGKTCQQLAGELKLVLEKKYYYHATVLIGLDIMNKTHGKVYLAGRVKIPGYLDIPTDEVFTVSKAILRAGGFSEFADKRHVKVTRKNGGHGAEDDIVIVDVAKILEKGQSGNDLELRPDDRVIVPSKLINF